MSFSEQIQVEINSVFDARGFERLRKNIASVNGKFQAMGQFFRRAKGMSNMVDEAKEFDKALNNAGLRLDNIRDERRFDTLSKLGFSEDDIEGFKQLGGVIRNRKGEIVGMGEAMRRVGDEITGRNQQITLGGAFRRGAMGVRTFTNSLGVMGGALSAVTPSVQNLQMKLLGLQFTMLTVAFVFGGLATGALGAVGVFETLSNTMKFLFLPSALNVLDTVLKLQEFVFGLSQQFREVVGNTALTVAAFASAISVAAILGKALLTVIGPLITLAGVLGAPLTLLLAVAGALGLIAFRGSIAAKEGSKLNSFLETAGNLASKLFKFTGQAASKLTGFLAQMFSNIGKFFMNADWGQIWSNFFDFAANARNKAGQFISDTFSQFKKKSKKINWDRVWNQFFDFTGEGVEEANDFLSDTINRFATWASEEADWKQIWNAFFEFKNNAARALGRFLGQMLGEIVQFIMNIDFGKIFQASLDASMGRQEALQEQKSLIENANLGASFTEGFQQGLLDAKFNEGPDIGPQDSASVAQTQQQFDIEVNTTINGKNTTSREDARRVESRVVGALQETPSSGTTSGRGVPQ